MSYFQTDLRAYDFKLAQEMVDSLEKLSAQVKGNGFKLSKVFDH